MIEGGSFEQVKVAPASGAVPDPRIAGPSIFFDSRLDSGAAEANVGGKPEPYI